MQSLLTVHNLSFGYKGMPLLFDGLTFEVNQGEVVTVLGASGSGKSTLLELIIGNLKPKQGTVSVSKLSQVFQDHYSSFHASYSIVNQIKDVAPLDELAHYMHMMHLDDTLKDKKPHELSGGQLQRFSIVRALLMKPNLLLLDEPTSALDNITQLEVMKLLMQFLDRLGIVMITHDEDLAQWCSDKTIRL